MFTSFKRLTWKASLLTFLTSLLAVTMVFALPGDLDTSFSGDGLVTSYVIPSNPGRSDVAYDIAIQSNGKIIAAGYSEVPSTLTGDFALIRYKPNGSLDKTTFSGDGRLTTNFGGRDGATSVAVQSDGKIIAAGYTCDPDFINCNVALARYKPGGGLDTTFSGDGKQITDFGGANNISNDLAIQSDGKIVLASYIWNGTNFDFAVYRYKTTCPDDAHCLDTTFGPHKDGIARFGFGSGRKDFAQVLAIQLTDGKIVVAGHSGNANGNNNNFAIARLNPNGTLDNTFGQLIPDGNGKRTGKQITDFGGNDYAFGFAGYADGRMVLVGKKLNTTSSLSSFAVARYMPNGSLDTNFNGTGKKVFSIIAGKNSYAVDAVVQLDGKIVVLGQIENSASTYDFALVRLNPRGGFDTTFSGNGKVTVDFGGSDYSYALARWPLDGKYVLGGYTYDGTQYDFALARVLP